VGDRVLTSARVGARGDADERLLARSAAGAPAGVVAGDDSGGVVGERVDPAGGAARPAGQVVLGAGAAVDLEPAILVPGSRGELDEPIGVRVQQPEMQ